MNRSDFQKLAKTRINEAKVLLENACYDGAYYLAGYAVECGLKACISKLTKEGDFPDREVVNRSWTHNLTRLVEVAELEKERNEKASKDNEFELRWRVVKDWSEDSRYREVGEKEAKQLYDATVNPDYGVLPWLEQHW